MAARRFAFRLPYFLNGCLGCITWPILIGVTAGGIILASRFATAWWHWVIGVLAAVGVAVVAMFAVMLAIAMHAKRSYYKANYRER